MGLSYCTYTRKTIVYTDISGTHSFHIKGEVQNTIMLSGSHYTYCYSLEEDIAASKRRDFCVDSVWTCSKGVKNDFIYICEQNNIPFDTVSQAFEVLDGHYY
jgi:hypothetical protein